MSLLINILSRYKNFAMTTDGIPEINSLTYLPFENSREEPLPTQRLALVLVEPRLYTENTTDMLQIQLNRCLQLYKADLRAEGLLTRFIIADIYKGPLIKDGRTLLAIRQFFKDVKVSYVNFEGAILIGNFPDAKLVRRVAWAQGNPATEPAGRHLEIGIELISDRAEIVLCDLTGNWQNIYNQEPFNTEVITAYADASTPTDVWFDSPASIKTCEFTSTDFTVKQSADFNDAFFLNDARYDIQENFTTPSPYLKISITQHETNAEIGADDHALKNIIARPDITVSRINAYHIAVNPDPDLRGTDGHTFINASGYPQTVTHSSPLYSGNETINLFTYKDFDLEKKILISYFNRNHRFRNGGFSNLPFKAGAISGTTDFNPNNYCSDVLSKAANEFQVQNCIQVPNANLQEYVHFLKTPAVLKYIMAHSNANISEFNSSTIDADALTLAVGGPPFRWIDKTPVVSAVGIQNKYTPTFDGLTVADLYLYRALWYYHELQLAGASLMIHGGCNVNSTTVTDTPTQYYLANDYGRWSNSEGILFFTNCLALFSRAKDFNDAPNGFTDAFHSSPRANYGNCWKSYFNTEADDTSLTNYNIQRKRPYFWSINGDWTLRLRNSNGFGLISLKASLVSVEVQPNQAWAEDWNFDAKLNTISAIGDIDNDEADEFIITSQWGMGILKYNGISFRTLFTAPRGTWLSGWRYSPLTQAQPDTILDIQNFTAGTANNAKEILIMNSTGMATLAMFGNLLYATRVYTYGQRLGNWVFYANDTKYCGSGRFDNDQTKDVVLISGSFGLGIISLQNSTAICMAPYGAHIGNWVLNKHDVVKLIADLDGDGKDEILISGSSGIGILKVSGGMLSSIVVYANGTSIEGYAVENTDSFALANNFIGLTAASQILVANSQDIHLLSLVSNNLVSVSAISNTALVNDGIIDPGDKYDLQYCGDINGDSKAEFILNTAKGVAIMGVNSNRNFHCYSIAPYNVMLGDWYLQTTDQIVGAAKFTGGNKTELLITKK